jgi:hypothetical protein
MPPANGPLIVRRSAAACSASYVVRLDERGYYGKKPWTPVPLESAVRMTSKQARKIQNWASSHNIGFDSAIVEHRPGLPPRIDITDVFYVVHPDGQEFGLITPKFETLGEAERMRDEWNKSLEGHYVVTISEPNAKVHTPLPASASAETE